MFVGATHTYGGTQGPWGGLVSYIAKNRQLQPYTKLTRTLHQTYGSKAYKPYTKLTPNLHQPYSCMDIQYCINYCVKPYTKLTPNLHETYGSKP